MFIEEKSKKAIINFRPQNNHENKIIITIPKKLDKITTNIDFGDLNVSDIKAKEAKFNADSSDILINKGLFDKLIAKNNSGDISTSNVNVQRTLDLNNDSGDININKMQPDVISRIKNNSGDISLHYNEKPKNTLLEIHNNSGDSYIGVKELKDKKTGDGKYKLQLFNDSGDIEVK